MLLLGLRKLAKNPVNVFQEWNFIKLVVHLVLHVKQPCLFLHARQPFGLMYYKNVLVQFWGSLKAFTTQNWKGWMAEFLSSFFTPLSHRKTNWQNGLSENVKRDRSPEYSTWSWNHGFGVSSLGAQLKHNINTVSREELASSLDPWLSLWCRKRHLWKPLRSKGLTKLALLPTTTIITKVSVICKI